MVLRCFLILGVLLQFFVIQGLATKCQNGNWWRSFDKKGMSQCPVNAPFITGFWRSPRGIDDGIYRLEQARCCVASKQYLNKMPQCQKANWVHIFDRRGWATCKDGYFLSGLERSAGNGLHNIEFAKCCKPTGHPNTYGACYHEDVLKSFDNKGWSSCRQHGYYIAGLYRSKCDKLYCIEEFKCCSMKTTSTSNTCKSAIHSCLNGGKCVPQGRTFKCACPTGVSGNRCEHEAKAVCSATGDPHYKTFDGRRFDFMGKCQYVLTRHLEKKFEVLQENERCGSGHRVSCAKSVTVTVNGIKIHVMKGGQVKVFGIIKNLPYRHNGVLVERLGTRGTKISTNVGLAVEYNGVYNVFVTIFGRNRGKITGLCGNYNGNVHDDNLKPDKRPANNDIELGDSWKVDRSCPNTPPLPHPCQKASSIAQKAKQDCSKLKLSPFNQCHSHVNHLEYIKECEFDVCACENHPLSCLCEAYASYATTCDKAGVNVKWRHLSAFAKCASPCAYDRCHNGGTCSQNGNTFKCTCLQGFTGHQCEKEIVGLCAASGDPHYKTFDGKRYNFMGVCEYVFAKDVDDQFLVRETNEKCWAASCVSSVFVQVKGLRIKIKRGGVVTVFGFVPVLPYNKRGVKIVKSGGTGIEITTDIGLTVKYNGIFNLDVTVLGRYFGKMMGLCGNFNGNPNDDYRTQDNEITTSINTFATSWEEDYSCPNVKPRPDTCLNAGDKIKQAKQQCALLKKWPFSLCHKSVNQDSGFIKNCEYDVCACEKHPHVCLCEEYDDYATQCSYAGVSIPWRSAKGFEMCSTPCAAGPCRNGGACTNHGQNYKCTCLPGYEGDRCEMHRCNNIKEIGVDPKYLPDSSITSSSSWNANHGPANGRLRFKASRGLSGAWCARPNNVHQWLQFDFGYPATVHEIVTQGRSEYNQWVTSYTVSSSDDGKIFKNYIQRGVVKVFKGNKDRNTEVSQKLSPVIVARFIRLHPKTWYRHISMRAGFRGCFDGQPCSERPCQNGGECTQRGSSYQCTCLIGYTGKRCETRECTSGLDIGMENGEITNTQITASSEYNKDLSAIKGRLNSNTAWCVSRNDRNKWLQVDFELRATITEILTQGRHRVNQWVTSFTVSYSRDGKLFRPYEVHGKVKVFTANKNYNEVVRNSVDPVIVTRYIRIHPTAWRGFACMRAEFVGCLEEWPCDTEPCLNEGTCVEYRSKYLCSCEDGFIGKNCEHKAGDCKKKS